MSAPTPFTTPTLPVTHASISQEPNTLFWHRVRRRSAKRWRRVLAEAAGTIVIGAVLLAVGNAEVLSLRSGGWRFAADPLSGASVISIGGGLAAILVAVWVAIAVQPADENAAEMLLARYSVLTFSARALSVAATILTGCVLGWYSGLPAEVDVIRSGAALSGWALLVLVSADAAALASEPEEGGRTRYLKAAALQKTHRLLERFGVDPEVPRSPGARSGVRVLQALLPTILATIVAPAIATGVGAAVNPPTGGQLIGRFVFAVAFSVTALIGWAVLSYLLTDRQYFLAALFASMVALVQLGIVLDIIASLLPDAATADVPETRTLARIALSVVLITAPPLFIHGIGALPVSAPHAAPRRTTVVALIILIAQRRYRRQLKAVQPPRPQRWDRLSVLAAPFVLIPPVGFVLATAAHARSRTTPHLRGRALARSTQIVSATLILAPVIVIAAFAFVPAQAGT